MVIYGTTGPHNMENVDDMHWKVMVRQQRPGQVTESSDVKELVIEDDNSKVMEGPEDESPKYSCAGHLQEIFGSPGMPECGGHGTQMCHDNTEVVRGMGLSYSVEGHWATV